MSEKDNMNHNELENEVEKVDDKDVVVEDQKKDDDCLLYTSAWDFDWHDTGNCCYESDFD